MKIDIMSFTTGEFQYIPQFISSAKTEKVKKTTFSRRTAINAVRSWFTTCGENFWYKLGLNRPSKVRTR